MTDNTQEPNTEAPAAPASEPDNTATVSDTTAAPGAPDAPVGEDVPQTPAAPATPPAPSTDEVDREIWDDATSSGYVVFDVPAIVTFLTNNPAVKLGEGGRKGWEFDVFQIMPNGKMASKILGTRARGLMRQLKKLQPIANRKFMITRAGKDFNTVYTVKPLA